MQSHNTPRVSYFYDSDVGEYSYGIDHPMKPKRISMTHELIEEYDLLEKMQLPAPINFEDMTKFHSDEYIRFLKSVSPDIAEDNENLQLYNIGADCPIFPGLYDFCEISVGGTLGGAINLNMQTDDICINWAGGLHHAKKSLASGFCYVNDIVLGILELLKHHKRVLYIDIDVHHGDGVAEAFQKTDRVLTVSFHKYGYFFPDSGSIEEIGNGKGQYYDVNVPLLSGMNDIAYESMFVPIISTAMKNYRPSAVVLQCGADVLTRDPIGCFNLTVKGHGKCVEFVKNYNLPLLMLGGGGYNVPNVVRCWTYATSLALGVELCNSMPISIPHNGYVANHELHIKANKQINRNSKKDLETLKISVLENLRMLPHAPGVQVQAIPEDAVNYESEDEDKVDKDERLPQSVKDKRIVPDNEFYDSEDTKAVPKRRRGNRLTGVMTAPKPEPKRRSSRRRR